MRIAYVCYWSVFVLDGVAKKISEQSSRWSAAGHEVEVFALSPGSRGREQRWPARPFTFSSPLERSRAARRLVGELRSFRPDVVYLRYDLLPPALHAVTGIAPTVIELNNDEQREYSFRGRRAALTRLYGSWNWRRLFRRAAGVVSVSSQLVPLVARFGKPTVVIGNGIELDGIEPLAAEAGGRPTLVFSGTAGQPWQGVDKIVELARRRPELDVTLLGAEPSAEFPPNVTAHGFVERAVYEPLLAQADAAFGSAALHRKELLEASPLKLREYLAYGLPVVVPYEDTDLVGVEDWWLLRLPNEESNLLDAAEAIVEFARRSRGRRVPRSTVEALIGAGLKEERRLAFFSTLRRP